jgi:dolichol-phosphate mannosyltransferase
MPTYNEALSLPETVENLFSFNPAVELLVVDDGSPDGTAEVAQALSIANPRIQLLRRGAKQGLGPAYLAGFEWALEKNYQLIVEMDADGSHRGEDLGQLLEAATQADLVIGSRWIPGGQVLNWPIHRKLISKIGNRYAAMMLGSKLRDMTSGFRVYRAEALRNQDLRDVSSQGYSFQVEMAYKLSQSGTVIERPITFVERKSGQSKMTLAIVLEALAKVTFWGLKRVLN